MYGASKRSLFLDLAICISSTSTNLPGPSPRLPAPLLPGSTKRCIHYGFHSQILWTVVEAVNPWKGGQYLFVDPSINILFLMISLYKRGHHIHHILQNAKLLLFCHFQPDKVANVLPDSGLAAQALKGAALDRVGSGRQRSTEERDHRGVRLSNLFGPFDKSLA